HRAQTAADIKFEAALFPAVDDFDSGNDAGVVHGHEPAGIFLAAGKRDLELAPEILGVGMAHHEARAGARIRRRIERFFVADAGERAGRHVAHHVEAFDTTPYARACS